MQAIIISDTHGLHKELKLSNGNILIYAGDITDYGSKAEVIDFLEWFSKLDYEHKIFIGGNHNI